VVGQFTVSRTLWLLGWAATAVMAASVVAMIWTMVV
jgi:hypothetical protein